MASIILQNDLNKTPLAIDQSVKNRLEHWKHERQMCPYHLHGRCNKRDGTCKVSTKIE